MIKSQLIAELVGEDLVPILTKLLECYKETNTSETYGKRLARQTEQVLESMNEETPLYIR